MQTDPDRNLKQEVRAFRAARKTEIAEAAQRVALQLVCGLDLTAVLNSPRNDRSAALARIVRLTERERLRGLARHWSYDVNRHIALKQAGRRLLDTLREDSPVLPPRGSGSNENGARKRRSKLSAGQA